MKARGFSPAWSLLFLIPFAAGCSDNKPARITSAAPSAAVLDSKPFALAGAVVNKGGTVLATEKVTYSANPTDVVSVSDNGECRCLKSGDATVLVAGGGLSSLVGVKCRLVLGVDVPREARFVVGEPASGFHHAFENRAAAQEARDEQIGRALI